MRVRQFGLPELYGTLKAMLNDYRDVIGNPLNSGLEPEEITEEYFIEKVKERIRQRLMSIKPSATWVWRCRPGQHHEPRRAVVWR